MVKENNLIIENKKPFEIVQEVSDKYEIPSFEEFMKSYENDGNVNYDDLNSGDVGEVKGYGPCRNSSCNCYCSSYDCICSNYTKYQGSVESRRYIKINKKTKIKGFQHLIHTGND